MNWSTFHKQSPYEGFPLEQFSLDLQGWNQQGKVFSKLIETVRPSKIIEVGTWKGASAIRMANLCKLLALNTRIICVDTWLGSAEFWFVDDNDKERGLKRQYGYPQVYQQFLANVLLTNNDQMIIPLPATSTIGARLLLARGIRGDLIYIDGSHDFKDVLSDLDSYLPVLKEGGVMFGDDFVDHWPEVQKAVRQFAETRNLPLEVEENNYWIINRRSIGS